MLGSGAVNMSASKRKKITMNNEKVEKDALAVTRSEFVDTVESCGKEKK